MSSHAPRPAVFAHLGAIAALLALLGGCSTTQTMRNDSPGDDHSPRVIGLFIDGTGNDAGSTTNVRRMYHMFADRADDNIVSYYSEGVGSGFRPLGMGLGVGMGDDIRNSYLFLAKNYWPDARQDRLYVFGFSRGAFAARSLLGFIEEVGLVRFERPACCQQVTGAEQDFVFELYDLYVRRHIDDDARDRLDQLTCAPDKTPCIRQEGTVRYRIQRNVRVHFLGLWDTVESQGFRSKFGDLEQYHPYHRDGWCSADHVMHALSLDDLRHEYTPKLIHPDSPAWRRCQAAGRLGPGGIRIEQVWFPGAHSDVGGGYPDNKALPGLSMNWMLATLRREDCLFPPDRKVYWDHTTRINNGHDDNLGFRLLFEREPRKFELVEPSDYPLRQRHKALLNSLHWSVKEKLRDDPYYPFQARLIDLKRNGMSCFKPDLRHINPAAGCFEIADERKPTTQAKETAR